MKPRYVIHPGTAVVVAPIDTNITPSQFLAVRLAAGVTLAFSTENPDDWISPGTGDPSVAIALGVVAAGLAGPQWNAAPAAVSGIITFPFPVRALQFTPTAGGVSTILQQGVM